MAEENNPDPVDRLVTAYERMLERVNTAFKQAEEKAIPTLKENLAQARERAIELGELTREEADKVAGYLERDMQDAADFVTETGQQLRDWWQFDLKLIEDKMLEMFANVADQTSVQLGKLAQQARKAASFYRTGEITGPGTLVCSGCGTEVHFHKTGHIPPCPGCRGTEFARSAPEA